MITRGLTEPYIRPMDHRMKIHKCLYTAQCIVPEAENLSPNYSHELEVFSCLDFFLDYSYLVSCRTHLYRLPGVKRSSRLITGGTVHKIDCALQSSIKIPKYRSTWPEKQCWGLRPSWGWEIQGAAFGFLRHLAVFERNRFSTKAPETPVHHGVTLLSLATSPKSIPLLALGKALPVCGRVSKKDSFTTLVNTSAVAFTSFRP